MAQLPPDLRHADPIVQRLLDWLRGFVGSFVAEVVTAIFGAAGIKIRFGSNSVTWPGGSPNTSDTTVTHGLGADPSLVLTSNISTTNMVLMSHTETITTFKVAGTTRDGSSPANGTQRFFYWLALAT